MSILNERQANSKSAVPCDVRLDLDHFSKLPHGLDRDRRLNGTDFRVLLHLLRYIDSRESAAQTESSVSCWPSLRTIARETGIALSAVRKSLANLQSYGYVEPIPDPTKAAGRRLVILWRMVPQSGEWSPTDVRGTEGGCASTEAQGVCLKRGTELDSEELDSGEKIPLCEETAKRPDDGQSDGSSRAGTSRADDVPVAPCLRCVPVSTPTRKDSVAVITARMVEQRWEDLSELEIAYAVYDHFESRQSRGEYADVTPDELREWCRSAVDETFLELRRFDEQASSSLRSSSFNLKLARHRLNMGG